MKAELLTPQGIMRNLTEILFHLTPAVDRSDGRYEVGDVIALCLEGRMFMWCVIEDARILAVCVCQFADYPRKRVLLLAFCGGGGVSRWIHLVDEVVEWGRKHGCVDVDADDARSGAWGKALGWKERYVRIGKTI